MTPSPRSGTPDGNATLAIQRLARSSGADVQELMTLYALEALLARVAVSDYRDDFVLKGGVLLAAFSLRRPTKDIDLQATGISNDLDEVATRISNIASTDLHDGVHFDTQNMKVAVIRDDDEYHGARVKLIAALGTARLNIGIDVNFGDPIWPQPRFIDLPRIVPLGNPPIKIMGYPLTMVLAEKILTVIDRGTANTRWRDFADVYAIAGSHVISAQELRDSFETVGEYRKVEMKRLLPHLATMPEIAQSKWEIWRRRTQRENDVPLLFSEVLTAIAHFADPVLAERSQGQWQPHERHWVT